MIVHRSENSNRHLLSFFPATKGPQPENDFDIWNLLNIRKKTSKEKYDRSSFHRRPPRRPASPPSNRRDFDFSLCHGHLHHRWPTLNCRRNHLLSVGSSTFQQSPWFSFSSLKKKGRKKEEDGDDGKGMKNTETGRGWRHKEGRRAIRFCW